MTNFKMSIRIKTFEFKAFMVAPIALHQYSSPVLTLADVLLDQ